MRHICSDMNFNLTGSNDIKACYIPRTAYTVDGLLKKDYIVGIYEKLKDDYNFEVNELLVDSFFEDAECFVVMNMFESIFKNTQVSITACYNFEDSICKNGELVWDEYTVTPLEKLNEWKEYYPGCLDEERKEGDLNEEV